MITVNYRIIEFKNEITVAEALRYVKAITVDTAFEKNGGIDVFEGTTPACYLGTFRDYYDMIFNKNDFGTKVYKNTPRYYKVQRFANKKIKALVMETNNYHNNYEYYKETLVDQKTLDKLKENIKEFSKSKNLLENNIKYKEKIDIISVDYDQFLQRAGI